MHAPSTYSALADPARRESPAGRHGVPEAKRRHARFPDAHVGNVRVALGAPVEGVAVPPDARSVHYSPQSGTRMVRRGAAIDDRSHLRQP